MTCVNVVGMILSRATERRTEIAIRYALGTTRRQIMTQLLTESAALFLVAGVTGALLAAWATPLLLRFEPPLPSGYFIDLDLWANWAALVYACIVATACGIVFSIAPRFARPARTAGVTGSR
jgi:putative ABC transport system permease protein